MNLQRDRVLRKVGKQAVKWAAEGAVKGMHYFKSIRVFCNVRTDVMGSEDDGLQ